MKNSLPSSFLQMVLYFCSKAKWHFVALSVIMSVAGIIPTLDSIILAEFTSEIINLQSIHNDMSFIGDTLIKWVVYYAVWWEGVNALWRLYDYIYLLALPKIKGLIVDEFYAHIQHHETNFFNQNASGFISDRIQEASRSFEMIYSTFAERIVRRVFVIILSVFAFMQAHYVFAIIFTIWLCIFFGISIKASFKLYDLSIIFATKKSIVTSKMVDSMNNVNSIKLFNGYHNESKHLLKYTHNYVASDVKMQVFMFKIRYMLGMSASLMIGAIVYAWIVLYSGNIASLDMLVLILSLVLQISFDIWDFPQDLSDLFEEIGCFSQSIKILLPKTHKVTSTTKDIIVSGGAIEFKNVDFSYNDSKIFNNKSIVIKPKEKVGLVGFTGSGKSTFVSLIYRLYDINTGDILIDDQSIYDVNLDSLRNQVNLIPQEAVLFDRSIMDNMRYARFNATDQEIMEASKMAHLHDEIMNMPRKYDTICGERGKNLSGGQRQRIIIARSFLKNSPILILDEATNALDAVTEKYIQDSLKRLMHNKTVLVIAHRLSTILDMDRIMVFDKGRIVEEGTHAELFEKNGVYKMLWESQMHI